MIDGEKCRFCGHWSKIPCDTSDDAEDCPSNDKPEEAQ